MKIKWLFFGKIIFFCILTYSMLTYSTNTQIKCELTMFIQSFLHFRAIITRLVEFIMIKSTKISVAVRTTISSTSRICKIFKKIDWNLIFFSLIRKFIQLLIEQREKVEKRSQFFAYFHPWVHCVFDEVGLFRKKWVFVR